MSTMKETVENARTTLTSAANNAQVLTLLAQCGYDAMRLQEGLSLCEAASEAIQLKRTTTLSKMNATQALKESWKEAQFHYQQDLRAARKALKESNGTDSFLQLTGKKSRTFSEWFVQATDFYNGINGQQELQPLVAMVGLTVERIAQGQAHLDKLQTLRMQQNGQKGNLSSMQRQRDEAVAAFERWMGTFRRYARLALESNPELIVSIGLETRGSRARKTVEPSKRETVKVEIPTSDTTSFLVVSP